jgi:hypothetical protein
MTRVLDLPEEALSDARALVSLTREQLHALDQLLSTGNSLLPVEESFVEEVCDSLGIDRFRCQQVLPISSYLLETKGSAKEVVSDLRRFLEQESDEAARTRTLASFDENREALELLCTEKQERVRARKVRRLRDRPEPSAESFRTICQLRPLFEGSEEQENIVGLVPSILVEIRLHSANDEEETVIFSLSREKLNSFRKTLERTLYKLDKIQDAYGNQVLGAE